MKKIFVWLLGSLLAAGAWGAGLVNINTATAEEIAEALKGVGLSKAQSIVEYRDQHGAFQHIDELVNVKGIGLRTVDENRDRIQLETSPEVARQDD